MEKWSDPRDLATCSLLAWPSVLHWPAFEEVVEVGGGDAFVTQPWSESEV